LKNDDNHYVYLSIFLIHRIHATLQVEKIYCLTTIHAMQTVWLHYLITVQQSIEQSIEDIDLKQLLVINTNIKIQ